MPFLYAAWPSLAIPLDESPMMLARGSKDKESDMRTVYVNKAAIGDVKQVETMSTPLADGAIRLRVQSFAVTANNVTYAAIGDMFGYWNFFPTSEEGQGVVPMWGHAIIEESHCAGIAVGERVYGYLPMATHLDVIPGDIGAGQFRDMTDYRQPMSPFYNLYSRLAADPEHDPAREDARMIFGPLFKTGFLIEAMFRRDDWHGAKSLIMTSASSKTAMALAHCAKASSPTIRRVGLTSAGNVAFVKSTGLYDQVLAYDEVSQLPHSPSVSVDFAGNSGLLAKLHTHLANDLRYSCLVGATHIDARGGGGGAPLPGPAPILFFAPDHATATIKELGPKGFGQALAASWRGFVAATDTFVRVDHQQGLESAESAFKLTVAGKADPAVGIVIKP
jgi:hypothetical protein